MDDMLRAADRDRDAVMDVLREEYALGRLTLEEFDERSTAAASARTFGELRVLTADLPAAAAQRQAAWSPGTMRRLAPAGVVAVAVLLGVAVAVGHLVVAWPVWLLALVLVRHAHGHRRPHRRRG